MKGSDIVQQIGPSYSKARQDRMVELVRAGHFVPVVWRTIQVKHQDGRVFFVSVMNDALKLGEPDDHFRMNCSHTDAQRIADMLDARLPTPRICDLVHDQCDVRIEPCTSTPDSQMASTARMLQHSARVTERIGAPDRLAPLVSTVGKDWVLTDRLTADKGANYGWHGPSAKYTSPGGLKLWQPLGLAHDRFHTDYSQTLRLVGRLVGVEDPDRHQSYQVELDRLLTDPSTAPLLNYEGVARLLRHPGVLPT